MFDKYIKALSVAISDNSNLQTVRKELEDIVMSEKLFSEYHGKEFWEGICLSDPVSLQSKKVIFTSDLYNPVKIRIIDYHDKVYPNPCAEEEKTPFELISRHPLAFGARPIGTKERLPVFGEIVRCYFTDAGPDDFGKARGIRYEYPIINTRVDYNCANKALESLSSSNLQYLNNLGTLMSDAPVDITQFAAKYDSDSSIPNRTHLDASMSNLHPQFVPYIKAFIYKCWKDSEIKITITSGYRSVAKQKDMRTKWDIWVAGGKVGPAPYNMVAAPATYSHHNTGTGIDFNPTLKNGKTITGRYHNKQDWLNTGVPTIIKAVGLRWGGNFTKQDRVHIDLESRVSLAKRKEMIATAKNESKEVTEVPF